MRALAALKREKTVSRRRREGAAAVEFAMLATPFFLMIFAVLELGLVFLIDSTLETAVVQAGRIVRTGQAQSAAATAAQFKNVLCARMSVFEGDCRSRAQVDVRVLTQFSQAIPSPIRNGELDTTQLQYDRGQPGDLMLVRVWYSQPMFTPLMSQAVSRMKSGAVVISVATAFRNEPYGPRTS